MKDYDQKANWSVKYILLCHCSLSQTVIEPGYRRWWVKLFSSTISYSRNSFPNQLIGDHYIPNWRAVAYWPAPMASSAFFLVEHTSRLVVHHLQWSGASYQSLWKFLTGLPTILSPFDMKPAITMWKYTSVIKSFNNKKL